MASPLKLAQVPCKPLRRGLEKVFAASDSDRSIGVHEHIEITKVIRIQTQGLINAVDDAWRLCRLPSRAPVPAGRAALDLSL